MTERFWEAPRPPHAPIPAKWDDLPDDPVHPPLDGATRMFLERHWHHLCHDQADGYEYQAATAVFMPTLGTRIEFGPWSFLAKDARALADSLRILADECDAIDGPTSYRRHSD